MFRNKGEKKFDQCAHKKTELGKAGRAGFTNQVVSAKLVCPKLQDANAEVEVLAYNARNRLITDVYHNPEARRRFRAYKSAETAISDLKRTAGSIACVNCIYAGMSTTAVAQHRLAAAEERRDTAQLEQTRMEAEVELRTLEAKNANLRDQLGEFDI